MINEKQINAQNAHPSIRMIVDSKTKGKKMKLTGKQYRTIVELQGKETADMMASTLGVAQSRVGKFKYAPQPVVDAYDFLLETIEENLSQWNENLPAGVDPIRKVDLNIKK
tara:strand:- start:1143 stop:1475 length:333 start_codon:yes stop_codon:yes gene_type:complete